MFRRSRAADMPVPDPRELAFHNAIAAFAQALYMDQMAHIRFITAQASAALAVDVAATTTLLAVRASANSGLLAELPAFRSYWWLPVVAFGAAAGALFGSVFSVSIAIGWELKPPLVAAQIERLVQEDPAKNDPLRLLVAAFETRRRRRRAKTERWPGRLLQVGLGLMLLGVLTCCGWFLGVP